MSRIGERPGKKKKVNIKNDEKGNVYYEQILVSVKGRRRCAICYNDHLCPFFFPLPCAVTTRDSRKKVPISRNLDKPTQPKNVHETVIRGVDIDSRTKIV